MNVEVGPAGGRPEPAAPQGEAGLQEPAGRQGRRREPGPAGEPGAPGPPQGPSASGECAIGAYVRIVTGSEVGEWARPQPLQITGTIDNDVPCIDVSRLDAPSTTVRKTRESGPQPAANHPAWAAQLIGEESELNALNRYAQLRRKHPAILAGFDPIVLHNQIGRSSTAAWHRVRIVMHTRQAAESLCARLQSSGEQCLVQRDYSQ